MTLFQYPLMDHMKIWDGTKVFFLFTPKKTTVYLIATYNSEHYSVDTNDDEDKNYQLSTTGDKENSKIEYPIDLDKQSPSAAAKIETAIFSSISAVPIV